MSKNVKINETNYSGVSVVQLPITGGGTAEFKDVDEIATPSGDKNITENGTYDVSAFARAIVNVASSGGNSGGAVVTGVQDFSSRGSEIIHNAGFSSYAIHVKADADTQAAILAETTADYGFAGLELVGVYLATGIGVYGGFNNQNKSICISTRYYNGVASNGYPQFESDGNKTTFNNQFVLHPGRYEYKIVPITDLEVM